MTLYLELEVIIIQYKNLMTEEWQVCCMKISFFFVIGFDTEAYALCAQNGN